MLYNCLVALLLILMIIFNVTWKQIKSTKIFYLCICVFILGIISACRYTPYGDFYNNCIVFIKTKYMSWREIISYSEFGHQLFRKFITLFTDNPQWYYAITSFFIILSFLIFIYRYSQNIYLSVFLFVTLGLYFTAHNITAQYMAISICLYSVPYLLKRNFFKFTIIVLIAMSFHISAIIFFPIYFLSNVKFSKKVFLFYLLSIIIIQLFFSELLVLVQKFIYSEYTNESYGMDKSNILNIILPSLMFILCIFGNKKRSRVLENDITNERLNNIMTHMGIISFQCGLLSVTKVLMMSRVGAYFTVSYLILIPFTIAGCKKRDKTLIHLLTVVLAIIYFLINNLSGRLSPTPYTPFWWY